MYNSKMNLGKMTNGSWHVALVSGSLRSDRDNSKMANTCLFKGEALSASVHH